MMKNIFLPLFLICSFYGMSQAELNKYKYIIVPTKFEAFKSENQYQTSTLIKYNLVENGFAAVYDNDMPVDLVANRCLGLQLSLKDDSSMFTTKVTLILKDCLSNEVYTTVEGISKEKDYKSAYSEAIKECFKSLSGLGYKFEPSGENVPPTVSFKNDVKRIEEKASVAPKQNIPNPVVQQKATLEEQSYKNMEPVQSNITKAQSMPDVALPEVEYATEGLGVLYAQPIANGFQLVDSTPKIAMWMWKTTVTDVYIAQATHVAENGIVVKKGDKWYFEYRGDDKIMAQELNIKF
ncbi:hypothetical protein [Arenibacter hampyeongensis]|uniref:hypothetical protein n=2 Tax=Arenibacter TaxID=178469 RepID=UPI0012FFD63D|nr:hypothetical protein [Arenibacter hampyeongensis]